MRAHIRKSWDYARVQHVNEKHVAPSKGALLGWTIPFSIDVSLFNERKQMSSKPVSRLKLFVACLAIVTPIALLSYIFFVPDSGKTGLTPFFLPMFSFIPLAVAMWWLVERGQSKQLDAAMKKYPYLFSETFRAIVFVSLVGIALCINLIQSAASAHAGKSAADVVTLGQRHLAIPDAFLRRPIAAGDKSALLYAVYPTFTPAARAKASPSIGDDRILILVEDAEATTSPDYRWTVLERLYGPLTEAPTRYGLHAFIAGGNGLGRPLEAGTARGQAQEAFRSPSGGFMFVDCNGDEAVPLPICRAVFADTDILFEISFDKRLLPNWKHLQNGAISLLQSFEAGDETN